MNPLTHLYHRLSDSLLDFVYPHVCVSCGASLTEQYHKVCETCWNSIQPVTKMHPLYLDTKEKLLSAGFISDVVSPYVFEKHGSFQHIAHALKYQNYESLGVELGRRLGAVMRDWQVGVDVVIPIPLHKAKLRERGFNQAEAIARGISSVINVPLRADVIRRLRHTKTQTRLNLEERRQNMEKAFSITPGASEVLRNKICLLVDDVITTGATITSCAHELLNAGAQKVIAASAALAQKGAA